MVQAQQEKLQSRHIARLDSLNEGFGRDRVGFEKAKGNLLWGGVQTALNIGIALASIHFLHTDPLITWGGAGVLEVPYGGRRLFKAATEFIVARYDRTVYDERIALLDKKESDKAASTDAATLARMDTDFRTLFGDRPLADIFADPWGNCSTN